VHWRLAKRAIGSGQWFLAASLGADISLRSIAAAIPQPGGWRSIPRRISSYTFNWRESTDNELLMVSHNAQAYHRLDAHLAMET
jgi:hypothetical protein